MHFKFNVTIFIIILLLLLLCYYLLHQIVWHNFHLINVQMCFTPASIFMMKHEHGKIIVKYRGLANQQALSKYSANKNII